MTAPGRSAVAAGAGLAVGEPRWSVPSDPAPERTTIAVARWQRRRITRALVGLPPAGAAPAPGVRVAVLGGVVLAALIRVAGLALGAG